MAPLLPEPSFETPALRAAPDEMRSVLKLLSYRTSSSSNWLCAFFTVVAYHPWLGASLAKHAVYAFIALSSRVMSPRGYFLSMGLAIICFQTFSQAAISAVFTALLTARQ